LQFIIDCALEDVSIKVPHLILQPLLENAIKHGVMESTEKVEVILKCRMENRFLYLELSNQFDLESNAAGQGIGHKNIKERLRLIYNRTDLFDAKIIENQYIAILKIPVN
jgi:LytS/YehU family sensor histidine kinase